ncbi:Transposase IS116/IS110/IS902 family protein [Pelotomaculum schinkii]|uniref:Transposase IS116/IS110/IS902 family protein n=1 Tax=Pelotomaculum schinkii TaxID=78350 RepID=A0A4Y7RFB2_9FIRM|nr:MULTISPECIES: IS110 family transposase [Pelotomaculum]TEB07496.1 Transposase IS116/IS110/IS902 family protein [Pelotomaculum schinkii]TEB08190.1 Transposase IS116/IS110/IS902 family protein [Pelotomaculum schinkii]TEB09635.1 Transposase IS116/IS110/IS902 family protein [Pelotomaculum sp. FP]
MSKLFVGIDVSLRKNNVRCINSNGDTVRKFNVPNTLSGAQALVDHVAQAAVLNSSQEVVLGLEATSNYGYHLASFFKSSDKMAPFSPQVHVLNARVVHQFKKSYNDLPKNDDVDAWVIADKLRFGRLPQEVFMDERFLALQRLTRSRFHLAMMISREKTYFLNNLFLKFSSLRQEKIFSDQFGATAIAVVQEFLSPDELAAMPLEKLVSFLEEKSKNRLVDSEGVAKALQKAARSSYRLSKSLADPVNASLATSISVIKAMQSELKKLDKLIAKHLEALPQTLNSIKGIGPVYAAGILAEVGDIKRFKNHKSLAKFAGLVWNEQQSGEWKAEDIRRVRSGNKYLRYYLVEAANLIRLHDQEYGCFYRVKYDEAHTHKHKRALVLTARKLVRLVYALLRTNQLYTPRKRGD